MGRHLVTPSAGALVTARRRGIDAANSPDCIAGKLERGRCYRVRGSSPDWTLVAASGVGSTPCCDAGKEAWSGRPGGGRCAAPADTAHCTAALALRMRLRQRTHEHPRPFAPNEPHRSRNRAVRTEEENGEKFCVKLGRKRRRLAARRLRFSNRPIYPTFRSPLAASRGVPTQSVATCARGAICCWVRWRMPPCSRAAPAIPTHKTYSF